MGEYKKVMESRESGGIDLNVCCSDNSGHYTVRELVEQARQQGMDMIAITGRDCIPVKDPVLKTFSGHPEILAGCIYSCRFLTEEGLIHPVTIVGLYPYGIREDYQEPFPYQTEGEYPVLEEVVWEIGNNLGIAVIPNLFQFDLTAKEIHILLREFCKAAEGQPAAIEVYCSGNTMAQQNCLEHLADQYGLLRSAAGRRTEESLDFAHGDWALFARMWHALDDYIMEAFQPFR